MCIGSQFPGQDKMVVPGGENQTQQLSRVFEGKAALPWKYFCHVTMKQMSEA